MKSAIFSLKSILWLSIILFLIHTYPASASSDRFTGFRFEEGKRHSSFKFNLVNDLILLPVTIDGHRLNLIFDTGMNSILIFNKKLKRKWKDREKHVVKFSGLGSGNLIKGYRYDDISVNMPNINGQGLSLVLTQYSPFPNEIKDTKIDGVFGYQLLAKFIVQIDYQTKYITLIDPAYFIKPQGSSTVNLTIFNTKPYIQCPIVIDDKQYNLNLLVDTGAGAGLILQRSSIKETKINNVNQPIGIGLAGTLIGKKVTVNNMQFGEFHIAKDFEALVPTKRSFPNESAKLIRDGTIGGKTLKQFRVTFDYFNNKLYLQSNNQLSKHTTSQFLY